MPLLTHGRVCPSGPQGRFMATGAPTPALLYMVPGAAWIRSPIVTSLNRICAIPVIPIASCSRPGSASHASRPTCRFTCSYSGPVSLMDGSVAALGPRWSRSTRRSG